MTKPEVPVENLKEYLDKEISVTDWFEITQERINQFAECTEDPQWIHIDEEKASKGPFGATIAHGLLLLSFVPPFFKDYLQFTLTGTSVYLNYGFDKVRFINPVTAGSRIRIRFVPIEFKEKGKGRFLIKVSCTFEIENSEKPACIAEYLAMFVK